MEQLCAHAGASKLSRDQLATILPPEASGTFKPITRAELIHNLLKRGNHADSSSSSLSSGSAA
jgi:hypothetical protein